MHSHSLMSHDSWVVCPELERTNKHRFVHCLECVTVLVSIGIVGKS